MAETVGTGVAAAIPDPVQWHEGMLLAPQHLQQLSARMELLAQQAALTPALPGWGARHLVIDTERLAAGWFRLVEAEIVLRDGYRFRVGREHGLELDLTPFAEAARTEPLYVFVAVPALPGLETEGELARYRSEEQGPVRDATGETEITMPVLRPKVSLWAGTAPPARLEAIPVARVRRREENFLLDAYHPPSVELSPGSELRAECGAVVQSVREKALVLAERLQDGRLASDLPALWQARLQLSHLTAALPALEALLNDGSAHPRLLHLRLCDLAGQLASLSFGLVPPHFPPYDHADIAASFRPLLQFARQALAEGVSEAWQRIPLLPDGAGFRGAPDGWLDLALTALVDGAVIVLGLRCPPGAGAAAMERWCKEAVIAGAGVVDDLLEARTLGLGRRAVNQLPGLVAPAGVCLFALDMDPALLGVRESLVVLGAPGLEPAPAAAMLYVRRFENGAPR